MDKIYDNGYWLLGKVEDIINYYNENDIDDETITELIEELKEHYNKESVVCINYDNGMGCVIEEFQEDSIIWEK